MRPRLKYLAAVLFISVPAFAQETTVEAPEPIITESTVTTTTDTTLKSPPASAISPTINTSNSDLCTFGVAGAVQTQILGVSTGTQITDGSYSLLVQYYVNALGGVIVDSKPDVFVIVHEGDSVPDDVKVFDPWRTYRGKNTCIYYGKTR